MVDVESREETVTGPGAESARATLLSIRPPAAVLPIGSRLLPPRARGRVVAALGFAELVRAVVEVPLDTETASAADTTQRSSLLDALESDLDLIPSRHRPWHPVVRRLRRPVRRHGVPLAACHRLIAAARQDLMHVRYHTFEDLIGYCALSGGSVGSLTVAAVTRRNVEAQALARVESLYTAARLIALSRSVGADAARDRVYLPGADLQALGGGEPQADALRSTHGQQAVVETQIRRGRYEMEAARQVVPDLPVFARVAVAGVYAEAAAVAEAIERAGFDPIRGPVRISRRARGSAFVRAVTGR